jgi:hypothetical protein
MRICTYVHTPQLVDFLGCEVQRGLVLCAARVADHSMQCTSVFQHIVNRALDGLFFCDIGFECEELAGEFCAEGGEVVACGANVEGVDLGCAVGETAVCDAEANSWGLLGALDKDVSGD